MSVRVRPAGPEVDRAGPDPGGGGRGGHRPRALVLVEPSGAGRPTGRCGSTTRPACPSRSRWPGRRWPAGAGLAGAEEATTFQEVADAGATWTLVVSYGRRELLREAVGGRSLAGRDWTFQIPDDATMELERQGYQ